MQTRLKALGSSPSCSSSPIPPPGGRPPPRTPDPSPLPSSQPRHTLGAHRAAPPPPPRSGTRSLLPGRCRATARPAAARPCRLPPPRPLVEPRPAEVSPRAARSLREAAAAARPRRNSRSYPAGCGGKGREAGPAPSLRRPASLRPLLAALPSPQWGAAGTSPRARRASAYVFIYLLNKHGRFFQGRKTW